MSLLPDSLLTKLQKEHVNSFRWLISGGRATGRSHLMAFVLLEHAVKNQGEKVTVFDHYPEHHARTNVLELVRAIASQIPCNPGPYLNEHLDFFYDGFKVKNTPFILTWTWSE